MFELGSRPTHDRSFYPAYICRLGRISVSRADY